MKGTTTNNRNSVKYLAEAVFVGPTPATGFHWEDVDGNGAATEPPTGTNLVEQLHRIQSASYNFQVNRTDVNQFGEAAAIDRPIIEPPTVTLDLSWIVANFDNEHKIGLFVDNLDTTALSGILDKTEDGKNYFIKTAPEGEDAVGTYDGTTIGIGNAFLTSFSAEGSVGNFPTTSVTLEGRNMSADIGMSGDLPAVDPSTGGRITDIEYTLPTASSNAGTGLLDISAIRPSDITLTFKQRKAFDEGDLLDATGTYDQPVTDVHDMKIQSYSLSFDLTRDAMQRLGSKYDISREVNYPINATLSVDAMVGELTTGTLSELVNCDNSHDVRVMLHNPVCGTQSFDKTIAEYRLRNAKLDSQNIDSNIGDNKSVTLNFSTNVGGKNQSKIGVFMSGIHS